MLLTIALVALLTGDPALDQGDVPGDVVARQLVGAVAALQVNFFGLVTDAIEEVCSLLDYGGLGLVPAGHRQFKVD